MIVKSIKPKRKKVNENGRLKIILAIIFLLFGSLAVKLIYLQIFKFDDYTAQASDQHQVFSTLEPERGKIIIIDKQNDSETKEYSIALNREYALVYAVPKNIDNPGDAAQKLYEILDQDRIANIVDAEIRNEEELKKNIEKLSKDQPENNLTEQEVKDAEDLKNTEKELKIEARKKKIISDYLIKLSKKDDPYEEIKYKVEAEKVNKLKELHFKGINYIMQQDRFYPEPELGGQILGFIGYKNDEKVGQYGLEGYFNEELKGKAGSVKAERSATGELIIVNDREYLKPENGDDLVLTIDRSIQFTACTKLREAVLKHGADGGSVIIVDPKTGAILAMCSYPDYDPNNYSDVSNINVFNNPAIFAQWESGSIFKAITMSAAIDQGKVAPESTYNDRGEVMIEGWPKPIKNSDFATKGGHGTVNMVTVLEQSLNTGVIFAMQKIGANVFSDYVQKFGFGEKTGIELETESAGNIRTLLAKKIRPIEAATATFGQGITVTPLQMVDAYAAIANGGILMKPYLVKEIRKDNGDKIITQPREIRRVITERTAALIGGMLVKVVENGHGTKAKVNGYYVAGKTGTAQVPKKGGGYEEFAHVGSFAGFAPVDDPVFTMLVKMDNPRDVDWAESSAAPLFGEIAQFILNYYQVAKER